MQMVLYCQMIYSSETIITIKHDSCYDHSHGYYCTMHNDTYSVHNCGLMLWRAHLLRPAASLSRPSPSTDWCQLLALFPYWRAGPPDSPSLPLGSSFPRIHTYLSHTVCYKNNFTNTKKTPNPLSLKIWAPFRTDPWKKIAKSLAGRSY
jgi:hypothetical protein